MNLFFYLYLQHQYLTNDFAHMRHSRKSHGVVRFLKRHYSYFSLMIKPLLLTYKHIDYDD